ncbi:MULTISPECIES: hypothetical protein [unclassified Novosphingobium]|uniref:hypothetical protein n=1 Tax=unclassified Novosphingobium TaxID=2644732 RepID=UPI000D30FB1A|nr:MULTISPECIES: hypothetical protein [unclassified Novosphingobium]PTR06407.1 hypothetical protein C8K11_12020 [Novosphingobium sp. GV055]PUA94826.1 hypothetical protein C8K12_12020 [Novosphingobium sp. GV061]PUB13751.1 hypothetical protein C8K14_12020 [Novosphingobium sp. GV079]PUB38449.1 hypothetical protein C8K10_12020 [Novosphingobium sp. GV027]
MPERTRHHTQPHAAIRATPLRDGGLHVAVTNGGTTTSIILTAETRAALFASAPALPGDARP